MSIKRLLLIGIVIVVTLIIGFFGYSESYATSLLTKETVVHSQSTDTPLIAGKTFDTEIVSQFDRLGSVHFRIATYNRINTNTVIFLLREKESPNWLVTNTYKTDRFIDGDLYPFGFPVIENSQGKTYEIEIKSSDGTPGNGIGFDSGNGNLQEEYVYSRQLLTRNPGLLKWFIGKKISELFFSPTNLAYWLMCFVPFLFILTETGWRNKRRLFVEFFLLSYAVLAYIFLPTRMNSNMVLFIGACVAVISIVCKRFYLPFIISAGCIGLTIISVLSGNFAVANRISTVIFISLLAGVIASLQLL